MFTETFEERQEVGRLRAKIAAQEAEITRLRTAIKAIAEKDGLFMSRDGNIIVDCGAPLMLTDAEREAVELAANRVLAVYVEDRAVAMTLSGLLERTK